MKREHFFDSTFSCILTQKSNMIIKPAFSCSKITTETQGRLFHERRAIARARAHAHLEMFRRAKNCPPTTQQIARLECFYFLQA